jgi:hypothetical protein
MRHRILAIEQVRLLSHIGLGKRTGLLGDIDMLIVLLVWSIKPGSFSSIRLAGIVELTIGLIAGAIKA